MKPYKHGITSVKDRQTAYVGLVSGAICRISTKTTSSTWSRDSLAVNSLRSVFNTLVRGEPLNTGPRNLASSNYKKRSIVRCRPIYIRLFHFVRVHTFYRRTDGRTDRQTSNEVRCTQKYSSLAFETGALLLITD